MSTPLLTASGTFDRRAIMLAAHAEARRNVREAIAKGWNARFGYHFAQALMMVWSDARSQRHEARKVALIAAMPAPVARLVEARMFAVHTDSSREMIRCITAIDAQLATLQVAA